MPTAPTFPAGTAVGFSYEIGLDINLGTVAVPNWQIVRRASAMAPSVKNITKDMSSYDDFGAPNNTKISEEWSFPFQVLVERLPNGDYPPEIETLKSYTEPDANGELAVAHIRWYDKPGSDAAPNANDAYEGFALVTRDRGSDGNADVGNWKFTLEGKGRRTKIANPFTGWGAAVPTISAATPSAAAVGTQVKITGTGFLGATLVKFAAVTATVYAVDGASTIWAVMPAGVAGSAPITVTNATGISAAFAYTRGA